MIAVPDDERQRRAQRPAVPQAGEHLDLVRLERLPRAATVPLLAPPQVGVDGFPIDRQAGRQASDDRDQSGAVRLARADEAQSHAGSLDSPAYRLRAPAAVARAAINPAAVRKRLLYPDLSPV